MSSERELRRALQRIQAPDELEGQRRAWPLLRAALEAREPIERRRRSMRPLLVAAAAVVVLAAIVSPPGRALVGSVRDVFQDEAPKARPALTALPARGNLLVNSPQGPWVVRAAGSKRLLGDYEAGSWSPNGRYVVVTRGQELTTIDWTGTPSIHWSIARPGGIRAARWSPEFNPDDTRIAYLNGDALRVVGGNGEGDQPLRNLVAATPPAWRPVSEFELAFSTVDGRIELVQTETGNTVWRTVAGEVPSELVWSEDGQRLLVLGERSLRVLDANGHLLWVIGLPIGPSGVAFVRKSHSFVMIRYSPATGRSDLVQLQAEAERGESRFLYSAPGDFGSLAVSPNGRWLLVGWVNADQWLFLRRTAARVQAVSNIAEQFGAETPVGPLAQAFPSSVSWCCPASP